MRVSIFSCCAIAGIRILIIRFSVVCRINTDEGICGFGEAGISIGPGENGVAHMLKDLSEMILGKDPLDNEVIWEDLHNRLYGHLSGGGVVVYSAMSAIDIALLDIKGKALGVPIYRLLGGKHNAELRCYLSQAQTGTESNWRLWEKLQSMRRPAERSWRMALRR